MEKCLQAIPILSIISRPVAIFFSSAKPKPPRLRHSHNNISHIIFLHPYQAVLHKAQRILPLFFAAAAAYARANLFANAGSYELTVALEIALFI